MGRTDDELDLWEDFAMVNLLTNPVGPDTIRVKAPSCIKQLYIDKRSPSE